jgi:small-conductance mechanosensitive channel
MGFFHHILLSRARLTSILGLIVLLGLSAAFYWNTRDVMAHLSSLNGKPEAGGPATSQNTPVDLHPWETAQSLAALAATIEEGEYAREAERLADHEVDQAFASALRQATAERHPLSGQALTLSRKLIQLQQTVEEDRVHVQSLTLAANPSASSTMHRAAPLTRVDDLDIAKAQLGLDSDEVVDAQQELAHAVGDERISIQQELAVHESAMHKYDARLGHESQVAVVSAQQYGTVAKRFNAWLDQRTRYQLIQQARDEALAGALTLNALHSQLELKANTVRSANAGISSAPDSDAAVDPASLKAATLADLKNRSAQRQLLGIYDDRIQTNRELAAVYTKWSAQVLRQHQIVQHLLLGSFALIATILVCVLVFDSLVRHLVDRRPTLDRRRLQALRIIFTLVIQFVGALFILGVVFGVPRQMPAILGLTTAGLTVVLQDFIIAFFGWFVLMGKSGIRVGDWVEINGVGGEVVEIGLFRTAMLETGNWTDKGRPTGRHVTFINSFAIKGQYFNFSTVGQWMWDEITLSIPAADDTYAVIELISKAVLKETEGDARLAEAEWKRVTRQNGLSGSNAGPSLDMRPSTAGIDVIVRYVTRASDRFEVRNRLYECVIGLLHKSLTDPPQIGRPQPGKSSEINSSQRSGIEIRG